MVSEGGLHRHLGILGSGAEASVLISDTRLLRVACLGQNSLLRVLVVGHVPLLGKLRILHGAALRDGLIGEGGLLGASGIRIFSTHVRLVGRLLYAGGLL